MTSTCDLVPNPGLRKIGQKGRSLAREIAPSPFYVATALMHYPIRHFHTFHRNPPFPQQIMLRVPIAPQENPRSIELTGRAIFQMKRADKDHQRTGNGAQRDNQATECRRIGPRKLLQLSGSADRFGKRRRKPAAPGQIRSDNQL